MTKKYLRPKSLYLIPLFLFLISLIWPIRISRAQNEGKPGDVVINELMWMGSSEDSYDEWIELRNITDRDISLEGWRITKNTGTETNLKIDFSGKIIAKNSYFVISYRTQEKSKLAINPDVLCQTSHFLSNDKLQITLYDNNSQIIDTAGDGGKPFFPPNSSTKASMERNDPPREGTKKENWHTATTSINFDPGAIEMGTPKAPNSQPATQTPTQQPEPSPLPQLSLPLSEPEGEEIIALLTIKEARQKEKDAEVLVEGISTVAPGTLSARYFYIQDQTAGIQIYFSKDFPALSIGQKVRILGTLSEAYNEKRIKISQTQDLTILSQEKEPEPLILKTGQINEEHEGMLVKVKGKVVEPKGNLFYLDDGSGKIKIYIKKETKIEKPRLKEGQELEVTGIVSQYKDAYRILPRKNDDLKTATGQAVTTLSTKKGETVKEEDEEEEVEEGLPSEALAKEGKVLGAEVKKLNQNWWLYLLILGGLGILGYLGYDYYLQKRKGNSKIWSKIRPLFERWRNYWANWRFGRR